MKGLKSVEKDPYNEIINYFRYCLFSILNFGAKCFSKISSEELKNKYWPICS